MKTINLKEKYQEIIPQLKKDLGINNTLAVPKIEKVVINVGVGKIRSDEQAMKEIENHLAMITGLKPTKTRARKAISAFKVREGMVVGYKVTLRKQKMWDFLTRLLYLALPRVRDFRGLPRKSFDKKGNFTIGIKEQIIFPEIANENIKNIFGLEICLTTTAQNKSEGEKLLTLLEFPFKK